MFLRHRFERLFLLFIACSLLFYVSCQSGPEETDGQCTVTFSVTNYRQTSFDDLSGSGTRAETVISLSLAYLQVTIFNAETNEQVTTILHKSDDYYDENDKLKALLFPKFSVTLPYGHYRVLVLGFNGSRACNIASPSCITWADNYVPNTFLYQEEFTLNEGATLNKEITLRHVVAAFCMMAEDVAPSNLKKMRFISTAGGTVLDATTGYTPQSTGRTSEIDVPSKFLGIKDTFTVYLFLPEEQITTNYTVQALDKNNKVLSEKHFNDVPLRINYLTSWQGKMFEQGSEDVPSTQNGFSIQWDMNWADTLKFEP